MNPSRDNTSLPTDAVGASTLERMACAPAFNRWMFDRLSPWVGKRVLEVGSGIGNMSRFLVDRELVVLTDTEEFYRGVLTREFGHLPNVEVVDLSLPTIPAELSRQEFDSIVCLNVLEHIEQDRDSLAAMRSMLEVGGHLVLLVPALPAIYGTLDRELGHFRRYTPRLLQSLYSEVGLALRRLEYFNLAGILGWFVAGRILRRKMIPTGALGIYDKLVPVFQLERLLPKRIGQSLIAIGERAS
jgi:SAM-dependent methyltransferase